MKYNNPLLHMCGGAWVGAIAMYLLIPFSSTTFAFMGVWLTIATAAPIVYHFLYNRKKHE
jgi:hypothetical protein